MALRFHPKPGVVLRCDFSTGFQPPEMVKARPVVVISPSLKGRDGLVTVVPLSSTPRTQVQNYHFQLPRNCLPQLGAFQQKDSWVKGDMVYTVAMGRLDLYRLNKRGPGGKRLYFT